MPICQSRTNAKQKADPRTGVPAAELLPRCPLPRLSSPALIRRPSFACVLARAPSLHRKFARVLGEFRRQPGPRARARCASGAGRRASRGAAAATAAATSAGGRGTPRRAGSPSLCATSGRAMRRCRRPLPAWPVRPPRRPPSRPQPHRGSAAECAGLSRAGTPRSMPSGGRRCRRRP